MKLLTERHTIILSPYSVSTLSNEGIHDIFDGVMCGYPLTFE